MSDEEIVYTTVRFHKSSELQNQGSPNETQGPRETGHRNCSVPWHLIAIPFGIFCSILLVAVAVLVKHIFQYSQEKHELQKTLSNLRQEYSTMQNDSYLWEEKLRNKSIEYSVLKGELDSLSRTLNRCYRETKVVLDCQRPTGKPIEGFWYCCGIKCYYFIMAKKRWTECEHICQDCSLSFLKIDDHSEMKFLQLQIKLDTYWIGLSYNISKKKWQWIDNQPSKLDLNITKFNPKTRRCAFLSKTRLDDGTCDLLYTCICERRLDKFFDSHSRNRT